MSERKVKTAYQRDRVVTQIPDERKTKAVQSEKKRSDINNIVSRAYKTGQLPVLMNRQPLPNLPQFESYQDALNKVVFAQQQFERLPVAIRNEFSNKPENMLKAIDKSVKDSVVKARLQEIGILEKPEPVAESGQPSPTAPVEAPKA